MSTINIALTGHRPNKLGGYNINTPQYHTLQKDLEIYIERNLGVYDTVVGHTGLALGADTIWSKAILAMKDKYPGRVKLHAHIPMLEQPSAWFNQSDKDFWQLTVDQADEKTVYGSLENIPEKDRKKLAGKHLNTRNEGMLNSASVLLALWDGSRGGTGNAVAYGRKTNMHINIVSPSVYF